MTKNKRARLWVMSPVIFYIIAAYIVLNICFGVSLWYNPNRATFIIENGYINHYFWAFVFWVLSAGLLVGIASRRNRIIKSFLIAGLSVKFIWWFAYIVLTFKMGIISTIAALGFWFFISTIQMVAIMFFPPSESEIRKEIGERLASGVLTNG